MNTHNYFFLFAVLSLLFLSCKGDTATQKTSVETKSELSETSSVLEVIQFHSTHRCKTCLLIEEKTREVMAEYPDVPFRLIDVDAPENAPVSEKYEAVGTALFVNDPGSGKREELTDFAFMHINSDVEEYKKGLRAAIDSFRSE